LKDREAVTTQWLSVHVPGEVIPDVDVLQGDGWRVIESDRHLKKLKTGALAGNKFTLVLRDITDRDVLESRLETVRSSGVPNYFGPQRFGHNNQNLERAEAVELRPVTEHEGEDHHEGDEEDDHAGETEEEHDVGETRRYQKLPDGSLLVDALIPVNDIEDLLGVELGDFLPYYTLAGLILDRLGRFPEKGETIEWQDFLFTCEEVTKNAILKVKITRIEKPATEGSL